MGKEVLSSKQGICVQVLFIMGSTLVLGVGSDAKQDVWVAVLLGMLLIVPVLLIYSKILYLFPDKDLFQILESLFGKVFGKIIALLMCWYAFHLGALVIRNFSEFISVVALPETPAYVPIVMMVLLCIWGVKAGIEILGRWSELILPILLSIIVVVVILSMTLADFNNLKPVLHNNLDAVMKAGFSVFSFPFAETVVFMMVGFVFRERKSIPKVYLLSLLIGGVMVLMIAVRNMVVLGATLVNETYFPAYVAVSFINIGDFLQRIEILVSVVFLFSGFIKISICLLAASRGVASVFGIKNYREIVAPIGLLMIALSMILYSNIMEMMSWAFETYNIYAFPFQVILPLLIWIVAELKIKKRQNEGKEVL